MKLKISKIFLCYFFCLLVFFEPTYFSYTVANIVFDCANIAIFVILLSYYIFAKKISTFFVLFACTRFIVLLSTIIHNGDIRGWCSNIIILLGTIILTEIAVKKNLKNTLDIIIGALSVYLYANLFTILMFPQGMDYMGRAWLMGYKSEFGKYCLAYLIILTVRAYYKKKIDCFYILGWIMSFMTVIVGQTATGLMGLIIFAFCLFATNGNSRIFNINMYYIYSILCYVFAVIINNFGVFSVVIENYLKKTLTFSGRTIIWENAFKRLSEHPIWGLGYQPYEIMYRLLGGNPNYSDCHSFYINLLFYGGSVTMLIFVVILYFLAAKIRKNENSKITNVFSAGIFAFLIVFVFEGSSKPSFWLVLSLAFTLLDDKFVMCFSNLSFGKLFLKTLFKKRKNENV